MQTANGVVAAYRVTLDSVTLGGITLNQIERSEEHTSELQSL